MNLFCCRFGCVFALMFLFFCVPHGQAQESCTDSEGSLIDGVVQGGYPAAEVESYDQGLRKNNSAVDSSRSNSEASLEFEEQDVSTAFFSLGFGGEVVVSFDCPVTNGTGDDLLIYEKTYGTNSSYPEEKTEVYAWDADENDWVLLGEASSLPASGRPNVENHFDLGDLDSTTKIKIVDITDEGLHSGSADAFDVNGVYALQDCVCPGPADECEQDNIVLNGSFEAVDESQGLVRGHDLDEIASNKRWDVFDSLPATDFSAETSWYTADGTAGIEIQHTGTVVSAQDGTKYVELDSHGNSTNGNIKNSHMAQDLDLQGGSYLVSFYYQPRTNKAGDNTIEVYFDDTLIHTADGTGKNGWEHIEVELADIDEGEHTLQFNAAGKENSLGGLIDNVNMSCVDVPEEEVAEEEPEEESEEDGDDVEVTINNTNQNSNDVNIEITNENNIEVTVNNDNDELIEALIQVLEDLGGDADDEDSDEGNANSLTAGDDSDGDDSDISDADDKLAGAADDTGGALDGDTGDDAGGSDEVANGSFAAAGGLLEGCSLNTNASVKAGQTIPFMIMMIMPFIFGLILRRKHSQAS